MKKINIHKPAFYSLFLLALLASSCRKAKLDNSIPLLNVGNTTASSIRFFNYYGDADITVNNNPLTAYPIGNNNGGGTPLGLSVFPDGTWHSGDDASPFTLPNSLVDKDGNVRISILPRPATGATAAPLIDTIITNNIQHPQDFYLMPDGHFRTQNRDNIPSANPQNFKIRIINLPSTMDPINLGLIGPVSLTYADGSAVGSQLNNVQVGAASPYIEVPYGAYQFKLFIAGGGSIDLTKQLAESPLAPYYDPCNPTFHPQQGISPRVRTFQPGGVYSIVVTLKKQMLFTDCTKQSKFTFANSYRVITELDPGVNNTFARMQAVNALPGKQVTISVDGEPLGNQLPYIGLSEAGKAVQPEYKIYVRGNHHVTAKDQNGALLAEADLLLYPFDNYTIWAYNKPDGKPTILFEANDMTGTLYTSSYHPNTSIGTQPDDGTNGSPRRTQYNYALQSRFLNLCPDLPFATFTNDHQLFLPVTGFNQDTIRYFSAYVNLAPGIMPVRNSSIIYSLQPSSPGDGSGGVDANTARQMVPALIRVAQSSPGKLPEVPGTILDGIAPVNMSENFIANAGLYSVPQFKFPETGVYTVALIGTLAGTSQGNKARLVVIKHNK